MADVAGDTKTKFGREYIYLNPPSDSGLPTLGTWRLREDDNGTPPVGGGGGGGTVDLSQNGTAGEAITAGQLLRTNGTGQLVLASAASISTANVIGVATNSVASGGVVNYTRNTVEDFFSSGSIVDGNPGNLTPGTIYYLSTTPGNWTATPDTTTSGAVVRSCGIATEINKMSIEIQTATVI